MIEVIKSYLEKLKDNFNDFNYDISLNSCNGHYKPNIYSIKLIFNLKGYLFTTKFKSSEDEYFRLPIETFNGVIKDKIKQCIHLYLDKILKLEY